MRGGAQLTLALPKPTRGVKRFCPCCGRKWIASALSITRPCHCAEHLLCRCEKCFEHCECARTGLEERG
jgi:hypothetical protein